MTDDDKITPAKARNRRDRYRETIRESHGSRPEAPRAQEPRPRGRSIEILPSPEILEGYDYVAPGSAKKILDMFEQEQRHRHQWEDQSLKIHAMGNILGQILGFAVLLSVLGAATALGISGKPELAAFIAIFGVSAMIWAYIRAEGKKQMYRPTRAHYYEDKEQERQISRERQNTHARDEGAEQR